MASSNDSGGRSKVIKFVDAFLTCRHCKKRLSKPSVLLCSHTFCRECLEDMVQSDETVTCPVCNDNVLLPEKGIEATKINTFVIFLLKYISLIESFGSGNDDEPGPCGTCALCEGEGISVYCQECAGAICSTCESQHERMKPFKGHTVVKMDEMLSGELTDVIRILSRGEADECCTSHKGEPLRFYCQRCHTPVCRDCTVVDHSTSDHRVVALDEIADSRRRVLGDTLEGLTEKRIRNAEFIAGRDQTKQSILDQKAEATNAIENITKELIQKIENDKKSLLEKLETITAAKLLCNEKVYEAAEADYKEMTDCCAISHLLMETGRDVDILHLSSEFHRAMKRQSEKIDNTSLAPELHRLGVVFNPQISVEDFDIGSISPVQYDQTVANKPPNSWPELGSLREFSSAFWQALSE